MQETEYDIYLVQKGDSLYSIANKFNTSVEELKNINNLKTNNLSVGEELKIPKGENNNLNTTTYIVGKGDSLYSIANKFNTTINELKRINNLESDNLSIGQKLNIKTNTNTGNNTYVVQNKESLYSIAKKFNTTVDELKRKNNLTSNLIGVGDILKI